MRVMRVLGFRVLGFRACTSLRKRGFRVDGRKLDFKVAVVGPACFSSISPVVSASQASEQYLGQSLAVGILSLGPA